MPVSKGFADTATTRKRSTAIPRDFHSSAVLFIAKMQRTNMRSDVIKAIVGLKDGSVTFDIAGGPSLKQLPRNPNPPLIDQLSDGRSLRSI